MKTLALFRHAKSDWSDAHARDFDRPLNGRGIRGAAAMGAHIGALARQFDRIIASPAVRVAETIEIASQHWDSAVAVEWDRRIYLASSAMLADVVRDMPDQTAALMMVGHNPGLEDLIFDLVPQTPACPLRAMVEAKFPTATFALLECAIDRWADLDPGCARLIALTRPRDLDPTLGPELLD